MNGAPNEYLFQVEYTFGNDKVIIKEGACVCADSEEDARRRLINKYTSHNCYVKQYCGLICMYST